MATAHVDAPTLRGREAARPYVIGLVTRRPTDHDLLDGLYSAAERLNCRIVQTTDAAALGPDEVDFVVTDLPSIAEVSEIPVFGMFEIIPPCQFVECKLTKLADRNALRLCCVGERPDFADQPLIAKLADRPYFCLQNCPPGLSAKPPAASGVLPFRTKKPQLVFATYGAGLVVLEGDDSGSNRTALRRLCEIVSVGAVAVCPDNIPWIRRRFGDTVKYYPADEPAAAAFGIDRVMEEIVVNPKLAAAQAQAARRIFEETLPDIMLDDIIGRFSEWRGRRHDVPGVLIDTSVDAITDIFARLADEELVSVAEAVASALPLQPVPKWRFGSFEQSPDLAVHVRHSLWLQAYGRGRSLPVDVDWYAGTRLRVFLDNDFSLTLFSGGMFEPNEFALLDRLLRPGMVFIDGGSNEGAYTIFAAARVGSAGRVIAIEPSARERDRLAANIARNQLTNIEIVEAALAERSGSAQLLLAEPLHAGQNTLGNFAYEAVKGIGSQEVALTTFDELVSQTGLDRVDIVKLDLEGAEYRALSGARGLLRTLRPLILTELSEASLAHQGASAAMLLELLEAADYVVYTMDDETGRPVRMRPGNALSDMIVAAHSQRKWPGLH